MEASKNWAETLNIPQEKLESWRAEAPEGVPLLIWCLKEGKVEFKDYAAWAKNHYSIPVITSEFFSQYEAPESIELEGWSPWMVPVGTWEGLTYVGCVLPPPDPEEGYVYLLAHPNDLGEVYSQMEKADIEESDSDGPAGLLLNLPSLPSMEPSDKATASPAGFTLNIPSLPSEPESAPPPLIPEPQEETIATAVTAIGVKVAEAKEEPKENTSVTQTALVDNKIVKALKGWWVDAEKIFTHAVLVQVVDSELHTVWANGETAKHSPLTINQPSLFRIAMRTQKPYHGFVIENEVHDEFFLKQLEMKAYPSSVTAIALPNEASFIVSYFGFIGKEGQELSLAESLTKQLAQPLSTVISKQAA